MHISMLDFAHGPTRVNMGYMTLIYKLYYRKVLQKADQYFLRKRVLTLSL